MKILRLIALLLFTILLSSCGQPTLTLPYRTGDYVLYK